ncbi:MAG TPA: transcription elongation factor GreA, partial [Candidatus Paceibacterota bacterium]|nr:transcription elongation factor GreA [Candidatus Paceibacterota bacterium]
MKEYLTQENMQSLEAELKNLSSVKRREILSALEYAKSLGDLSENAEYHQAREEQRRLEERISQIEHVLKNAVVVKKAQTDKVTLGSLVTIQKKGEGNTRQFHLVGS